MVLIIRKCIRGVASLCLTSNDHLISEWYRPILNVTFFILCTQCLRYLLPILISMGRFSDVIGYDLSEWVGCIPRVKMKLLPLHRSCLFSYVGNSMLCVGRYWQFGADTNIDGSFSGCCLVQY